ncbi:MAG: hypothetical protein SFX18_14925 [Pirellulales bacterium]|nr:hypothetical protein [Pirellulales bacterium]
MESTLHQQLKRIWAGPAAQCEVRLGKFIIDAVVDGELVEIQHGSLLAIRDKIAQLLREHPVRVVKPLIYRKQLYKRKTPSGPVYEERQSPKLGTIWDLFAELVHFTRVFPHPRLILEVPLIEIAEWRYPGHGRRRRWRKNDFIVQEQRLSRVEQIIRLNSAADMRELVEASATQLPRLFHTGDLATQLKIPRWQAQQLAYVLRHCGCATRQGKAGRAWLHEWTTESAADPPRFPAAA